MDHILTQPMKIPSIADELAVRENSSNKVKNAMEIVSILSHALSSKEKDLKEVSYLAKKLEGRLDISEKENHLCKA